MHDNRPHSDGQIKAWGAVAQHGNDPAKRGLTGRFVAIAALTCGLAGCGDSPAPPPLASPPAPIAASGAISSADQSSQYVIGPGDVLSIFVYEAPPLSVAELPVRPDGRISVPLVPDMVAAGKTPSELAREIEAKLKKYVQTPNVTVMVRTFQGPAERQVRVIGEASDPQAIPYRENMTVLDVMIATKGLTKYAAGNRAMIMRHEGGREVRIPVHLSDLIKDGDISQNMPIKPGDTLIIPQSWF
jgi:polysaccharide export outer membrane protein